MSRFVGVDVGGTKSAAVVVNEAGETLTRHWSEHGGINVNGAVGARTLADIVLGSITAVLDAGRSAPEWVGAYGVAVAGLVSSDQSTVVNAAKLRVRQLDLGATLSSALGRPVLVQNDANAALFGHCQHSSAASVHGPAASEVVLLLTLGTGTGGALMAGGRPVIGAHGFAAELGHVLVDYDDDRVCLCGSVGCLENYASGRGLEELAALRPPPAASRAAARLGVSQPVSSRTVVGLAYGGDPWAVALLEHCGAMLGRALTTLCTALDPTSVVISGSFGHATQRWLLPAAVTEMTRRWPFAAQRPLPELRLDTIGPYAAATGAALIALASENTRNPL